jgi:phosphopantetheine--protein transferase-like protein
VPASKPAGSICGIGIDVIEVARIEKAMRQPGFAEHILHSTELPAHFDADWLAVRWALKEAVAKAVGVHLAWHDVRIREEQPDALRAQVVSRGEPVPIDLHLTVSAADGIAMAWVIAEVK